MEAPHLERKLVAILAADVEGFSRHMERDEPATLATLSSHRLVIDALISGHSGRITGTAGDSVLAEFGSVVSAVSCAVKVQEALAQENAKLPPERRLFLRIGINIGDVMIKDGDIFGDGVNIAARLESLAEPGGICVSRGVRDHVRKHRLVAFEDLGEQKVKNISQPVRAFKVRIGDAAHEEPVAALAEGAEGVEGPALPTSSIDGAELALAFWNSIKDSESVREFELFLERYPEGPLADLAKARLEAIGRAEATLRPQEARREDKVLAVELAYWEAAKDSNSATELRAYLERYPSGEFTALAQARLDALEDSAGAEPVDESESVAVELSFWETVKDSRNPEMLKAYAEKYPDGPFIELAKIILAELQHAKEN